MRRYVTLPHCQLPISVTQLMTASKMSFMHAIRRLTPLLQHDNLFIHARLKCTAFSVAYDNHGDPNQVLKGEELPLPDLSPDHVLVQMMAAPINPADINMIQGVYPVKPTGFPAVGGNEGVGRVLKIGTKVTQLNVGEWVLPTASGLGTWRTKLVTHVDNLLPIPDTIPLLNAATVGVNPCTAYRMLKDFCSLNPGDVVIQNGANSGVGQAVIQIAVDLGLQTVNIVRNRENIDDLVKFLKDLGASHVITDEFVRSPQMKELVKDIGKPKLALNCVGGKSAVDLLKYLARGGVMVTYGGMSRQPMMVPAGPLIFNDVSLRGFWMTQWNKDNRDSGERHTMMHSLCKMMISGHLREPAAKTTDIRQFKDAISRAMEPYLTEKQVLLME